MKDDFDNGECNHDKNTHIAGCQNNDHNWAKVTRNQHTLEAAVIIYATGLEKLCRLVYPPPTSPNLKLKLNHKTTILPIPRSLDFVNLGGGFL